MNVRLRVTEHCCHVVCWPRSLEDVNCDPSLVLWPRFLKLNELAKSTMAVVRDRAAHRQGVLMALFMDVEQNGGGVYNDAELLGTVSRHAAPRTRCQVSSSCTPSVVHEASILGESNELLASSQPSHIGRTALLLEGTRLNFLDSLWRISVGLSSES